MNPKILTKKRKPESIIQEEFGNLLKIKNWSVRSTHGNLFMMGFPDDYACHISYGSRWIEYKCPTSYQFTRAQLQYFSELNAHGVGVWIICAATEYEYKKLFQPQNWWHYVK